MTVRDWGVFRIHVGDCRDTLREMPDASAHCCVTSPPYFGLRDYGVDGQIGLEQTPTAYVEQMVAVFREVRRVLRDDGTLWLNLGDSYAGSWGNQGRKESRGTQRQINGGMISPVHDGRYPSAGSKTGAIREAGVKPKDLYGIPWRVAFALQTDGWWLRQDLIWHKPNPMPSSVRDRCTTAHEYIFMLSKSDRYYFDHAAMQEPATNAGKRVSLGAKSFAKGQAAGKGVAPSGNGHAEFYDVPATRNKRSVWTVPTRPFDGAHFATFPPALIEPCVLAGAPVGGVVVDPFGGAGTTALVAAQHKRVGVLCELNPEYADLAERRIATAVFGEMAFGTATA